jgi:hypothetical protein
MVSRDEGMQIASTGNMVAQDWDAAWDSDEEDTTQAKPTVNLKRASVEEERQVAEVVNPSTASDALVDDDDAADAWGWGDEEIAEDEDAKDTDVLAMAPSKPPLERHIAPETREVTLSEPYWTSSLPQPVFSTVTDIYSDAARLTSTECVYFCYRWLMANYELLGLEKFQLHLRLRACSVYQRSSLQCIELYHHFIMAKIRTGTCRNNSVDFCIISNLFLGTFIMIQYGSLTNSEITQPNGKNGMT